MAFIFSSVISVCRRMNVCMLGIMLMFLVKILLFRSVVIEPYSLFSRKPSLGQNRIKHNGIHTGNKAIPLQNKQ